MKLELTFVYEKETPGTVRFKEQTADATKTPLVGTLYLKKQGYKALGNPGSLVVTLESGD